ncbi:MAG: citrate lyase subunit alpha [Bacillota bacterium]
MSKTTKVIKNLKEAIEKAGIEDGMTISFHHHFRDGDILLNKVMDIIAAMGVKDLTLVATSLRNKHNKLIKHIKNNVITKIYTSGLRGELGEEIQKGIMREPVTIYSHGGRAGAISTGRIKIDIAFIAASCSDSLGNMTGIKGSATCGSLGYAKVDALHADKVIGVTDTLVDYPAEIISISQKHVDFLVIIDSIGDSDKIATGSLRKAENPKNNIIADNVVKVIKSLSEFKNGFSLQTGSGSISLSILSSLKKELKANKMKGSFLLGGITIEHVGLLEEGYFNKIFDTQTFDPVAAHSLYKNYNHQEIDAELYASYFTKSSLVESLDIVVLSALEVDLDLNVNVLTGVDGRFRGASGGHSDTAAGSEVSIVAIPTRRGRIPTIRDSVTTIITPGRDIDIIVTEKGISINPDSDVVLSEFDKQGLKIIDIVELKDEVESITGKPKNPVFSDKVVAEIEYRDGSIIDIVRGFND